MASRHAKRGASGSERWMNCPGSLNLIDELVEAGKLPAEEKSGEAAENGTASHMLAERCLETLPKKDRDTPFDYVGSTIETEQGSKFKVDAERAEFVKVYTDFCAKLVKPERLALGEVVYGLEHQVNLRWLFPGMFGTVDFFTVDFKNQTLHIVDLKYGYGYVDEKDNTQLMYYALGVLYEYVHCVKKVHMTIVQPRVGDGKPRTFKMKAADLLRWGVHVLAPAAKRTVDPKAPCIAGPWCKWCRAKIGCNAFVQHVQQTAQGDFQLEAQEAGVVRLPRPQDLKPEHIAQILEMKEMLKEWMGRVDEFGQTMAEQGVEIPGFKLARGRSVRQWADPEEARETIATRCGKDAIHKEPAMISPADFEKLLRADGVKPKEREKILAALVYKPEGKLKLVPDRDPRKKQQAPNNPRVDFADEIGDNSSPGVEGVTLDGPASLAPDSPKTDDLDNFLN